MTASADRQSVATVSPVALALIAASSAALLLWVSLKPTLAGINSDAAIYVLLADWLSPWRTSDITFGARLFEHYPFPPLYPLLLAALGGGSAAPALAYGLNAVLQALAAAATWAFARRAGMGNASALLGALCLVLTPIALFTAMGLFSEPLYLALTMSALAMLSGARPEARHWHGAALLLGLAAVTRGVGLFAVLALLLVWGWRPRGQRARLTPLLALTPPLAWMAIKAAQGWHGSYTHNLFGDGVAPVLLGLVQQVPTNLRALAYHFVRCFDSLGGQHNAVLLGVLMIPAVVTLLQRLRRAELDAVYAVLYVGVIALWPYPNHFARFLLILLPLFGIYAAEGVTTLLVQLGAGSASRHGASLTVVLVLLLIAPSTLQVVRSIATAQGVDEQVQTRFASWYEHDSLAEARRSTAFSLRVLTVMDELGTQLPVNACVSSTMAEVFMLHARRYSQPPPSQRDDVTQLRAALKTCPYVLLLGATAFPAADFPAFYPAARVADDLQALHTAARDPARPDGPPLAILARYRTPEPLPAGDQTAHE